MLWSVGQLQFQTATKATCGDTPILVLRGQDALPTLVRSPSARNSGKVFGSTLADESSHFQFAIVLAPTIWF
jgi:hypothetical protein